MWKNIGNAPAFMVSQWQFYRLKHLLLQHFLHNPFYRAILNEAGFASRADLEKFKWGDLARIPILGKDAFREQPVENCIAKNVPRSRFRERSTSGSTGNPFRFWIDLKYQKCWQSIYTKAWRQQGHEENLKLVIAQVIQESGNYPPHRLFISGLKLYEDVHAFETVKKVLDFGGRGIISFPSFLIEFCNLLEKFYPNIKKPVFETVFTSGEALSESDREFIKNGLGCEIFDRYGVTEFFIVGQECGQHDGFHLNPESHIFEVVDDKGAPLSAGDEGKIVITNLDNEIMPFVRYDTGDLGRFLPKRCLCGNPAPLFKIRERRNIPKIWVMSGRKINPFLFYELFLDQSGIIQYYQIRKKSENHIQILVVPGRKFIPAALDIWKERVGKALPTDAIRIDFVLTDKIPPAPNGKRQDFVDEKALIQ